MTLNPANFTEASLADQIFSRDDDVAAEIRVEPAVLLKNLRPLKWNELVRRGDFVASAKVGFEPWVGPSGFRADAFVTQIYRLLKSPPARAKKTP